MGRGGWALRYRCHQKTRKVFRGSPRRRSGSARRARNLTELPDDGISLQLRKRATLDVGEVSEFVNAFGRQRLSVPDVDVRPKPATWSVPVVTARLGFARYTTRILDWFWVRVHCGNDFDAGAHDFLLL